MKIILLKDVKSLGKKGDIINANDGYARNYILPQKIGVEANSKNLNDLKLQNANADKIAAQNLADAQALGEKLGQQKVVVSMKAGEGGRVFGSVSTKEIAEETKKQTGIEIDKKKIQLPEAIKGFGMYDVPIKLHPKVTATLKVHVVESK